MSTERDELLNLVEQMRPKDRNVIPGGRWPAALVDQILAAGWRKPREITTVDELDALPIGSIVRAVEVRFKNREHGRIFERVSTRSAWLELDPGDRMDGEETWRGEHLVHYFKYPVTVLYTPEER